MATTNSKVASVFKTRQSELASNWIAELKHAHPTGKGKIDAAELETQVREFLALLAGAITGQESDISAEHWREVREFVADFLVASAAGVSL